MFVGVEPSGGCWSTAGLIVPSEKPKIAGFSINEAALKGKLGNKGSWQAWKLLNYDEELLRFFSERVEKVQQDRAPHLPASLGLHKVTQQQCQLTGWRSGWRQRCPDRSVESSLTLFWGLRRSEILELSYCCEVSLRNLWFFTQKALSDLLDSEMFLWDQSDYWDKQS